MAEDDIYGNKIRYERFKQNLTELLLEPSRRKLTNRKKNKGKYYCVNPSNLAYFEKLFVHFEAKDLSYIRRMRILHSIQLITYASTKDLMQCTREDINKIMANMHSTYLSPKSKETFIK